MLALLEAGDVEVYNKNKSFSGNNNKKKLSSTTSLDIT